MIVFSRTGKSSRIYIYIFIKILTAKANIKVIRYFSLGSRNKGTISGVGWGGVQWMGGVGGGVRGVKFNKENRNTYLGLFPNNVRVCGIVYHK